MTKKIALVMVLGLFVSVFSAAAFAQLTTSVKGKALDETGKPIVGATVQFESQDTGRKMPALKTDKKGEYFSMGYAAGKYKVSLLDPTGKVIWQLGNIQVGLGQDNVVDFDMAKEHAAAAKASGMSEQQRKANEEAVKENTKIKGLNQMLTQASDARKAGNCDEAINVMSQATQADATKYQLWYSLGESYFCAKKYPDAIEAYKKAIALSPKGELYNNLGQAYVKNNQTDEALKAYDQAAALDPTGAATYYFNEGAVLTNSGKTDDAAKAFDKAIAADPNKAPAYYWKGVNLLAKATTGKDGKMTAPEGTAEALNKYLELDPTGPYAEGAKGLLASMGAKVETSFSNKGKKK